MTRNPFSFHRDSPPLYFISNLPTFQSSTLPHLSPCICFTTNCSLCCVHTPYMWSCVLPVDQYHFVSRVVRFQCLCLHPAVLTPVVALLACLTAAAVMDQFLVTHAVSHSQVTSKQSRHLQPCLCLSFFKKIYFYWSLPSGHVSAELHPSAFFRSVIDEESGSFIKTGQDSKNNDKPLEKRSNKVFWKQLMNIVYVFHTLNVLQNMSSSFFFCFYFLG